MGSFTASLGSTVSPPATGKRSSVAKFVPSDAEEAESCSVACHERGQPGFDVLVALVGDIEGHTADSPPVNWKVGVYSRLTASPPS